MFRIPALHFQFEPTTIGLNTLLDPSRISRRLEQIGYRKVGSLGERLYESRDPSPTGLGLWWLFMSMCCGGCQHDYW